MSFWPLQIAGDAAQSTSTLSRLLTSVKIAARHRSRTAGAYPKSEQKANIKDNAIPICLTTAV
jgi:hypothetical protein